MSYDLRAFRPGWGVFAAAAMLFVAVSGCGDDGVPPESDADTACEALKIALDAWKNGDDLDELKDRPRTTGDLASVFPDLDRTTVMQHLRVLEDAGLVIVQRKGRVRWNHLNALPIKHIHDRWIGAYASSAVEILDRLGSDLEDAPVAVDSNTG